jgi:uncharacterized glyoxalase superfamily protein PhnB
MKPVPSNWSRISSCIYYQDAAKAIDWLCNAFGFELRLKVEGEGGLIHHSELVIGDAVLMVADERKARDSPAAANWRSPRSLDGANTQSLQVYVDDLDAHFERARKAGAKILDEPKLHDYGDDYWADRAYGCNDLDGHTWWFAERIRDPKTK